MQQGVFRNMGHANHHSQPVHLFHNLHPKSRKLATLTLQPAITQLISAIPCELQAACTNPIKMSQQRQALILVKTRFRINLDRATAFYVEEKLYMIGIGWFRNVFL